MNTRFLTDLENPPKQELQSFSGRGLREKSGVYVIENTSTGKIYIGSSRNIGARILSHKNSLEHNGHTNHRLQQSFNKTKEKENFVVHIGLTDTREDARTREQEILDECHGHELVLNISDQVNRGGDPADYDKRIQKLIEVNQTEESRERKSEVSKRMWEDEEYRKKMIRARGDIVNVDGVEYNSVREASRETGVSVKTIRDRLVNNECSLLDVNPSTKKVICEGVEFESVALAAEHYGVKANTMTHRLKSDSVTWKNFEYAEVKREKENACSQS